MKNFLIAGAAVLLLTSGAAIAADAPKPTLPPDQPRKPVCAFPATMPLNLNVGELTTIQQWLSGTDYSHKGWEQLGGDFGLQIQALTAKYCK